MRQPNSLKQISKKVKFSKCVHSTQRNNHQPFDTLKNMPYKMQINSNLNFHQNQLHQVNQLLIKISCLPLAIRINPKHNKQQQKNIWDKALNVFVTDRGVKITVNRISHLEEFDLQGFTWLKISFKQVIDKVSILKKDSQNFNLKDHIIKSEKELMKKIDGTSQKYVESQIIDKKRNNFIFSFIFPQINAFQSQSKNFNAQLQVQKYQNQNQKGQKVYSQQKLYKKFRSTQLRKINETLPMQIQKLPKLSIKHLQKPSQPVFPRIRIAPDKSESKPLSIYKSKISNSNNNKPDIRDNTTTHTDNSFLVLQQSKTLKFYETHKNMYVSRRLLKKKNQIQSSTSNKSIISIKYNKNKQNNQLKSLIIQNEINRTLASQISQQENDTNPIQGKERKKRPTQNKFQQSITINQIDLSQSQIQRRKSKFNTQKMFADNLLSSKINQKSYKFLNKKASKNQKMNAQTFDRPYQDMSDEKQSQIQEQILKQKSQTKSVISNQWSQKQQQDIFWNQKKQNKQLDSSLYESEQVSSRNKSSIKDNLQQGSLYESVQI